MIKLWGVIPGHPGQLLLLIFAFEEKNSQSQQYTPQKLRAVKSTKLLVCLTRSAPGVASLQKKNLFQARLVQGT